jgi:ankyrin repeat protein
MSKNSGELQVHKNMEAWDKYVRTRDLDALVSWAQAEGYPANDTGLVSLPEIAVENGDLNALDRLIKLGYDVNLVTDTGFSLLHNAISERAQAKDVAVVTYLMEHGARLDAARTMGFGLRLGCF